MRHRVKFCEDRSNRSGDMADFRFSGWRPSAILDLFYACWDHPQRVFAHPWAETPSYDVNIVKIGQLLRARREPKNKAKKFKTVYLRSHNRCSPIPPTLQQRHMDLCVYVGVPSTHDVVIYSKFHRNSFRRFGAQGVKICPFQLLWLLAFTTPHKP